MAGRLRQLELTYGGEKPIQMLSNNGFPTVELLAESTSGLCHRREGNWSHQGWGKYHKLG
jgi:hypothetical protein